MSKEEMSLLAVSVAAARRPHLVLKCGSLQLSVRDGIHVSILPCRPGVFWVCVRRANSVRCLLL